MRLRTRTLLVTAVLACVATAVLWRLGQPRFARRVDPATPPGPNATVSVPPATPSAAAVIPGGKPAVVAETGAHDAVLPASLRSAQGAPTTKSTAGATDPDALRLRNTLRTFEDLARDDRAVLLRNALIDTTSGASLPIPDALRAPEEPGSFIIQSRGPIGAAFRDALAAAGATYVAYLPNNAYQVKATASQADRLRGHPEVGAVLPFEPYFKLEPALLALAIQDQPLDPNQRLNVTLLPGENRSSLEDAGVAVQAEFSTPFGPGFVVQPDRVSLASLARLPVVQGVERYRQRQLLNDLARERLGISSGTNTPLAYTNYLGLTGTNVVVNINDSGVDSSHPDLAERVTADVPSTLIDFEGHGTHVAGTIAGSGKESGTVSNAPGSILPGADFRGMAPAAELFALPLDLITGPLISDTYLQKTAATNYYVTRGKTNFPISNNSWGYIGAFEYTTASASYDAAVRDALPEQTGSQPILYVFSAGNEGFGGDDGQAGEPNTVRAPGTAKNVITVGAIESPRGITNEVIFTDADGNLRTNQVFLGETDTDYQVTSFSSRGNVEPGIEGAFGRFKPDIVAPGSFIASARSKDWIDPTAFNSALVSRIVNQQVPSGGRNYYSLYVPEDAAEFRIRILPNFLSPDPFPGLPLYLRYGSFPGNGDLIGTNNLARVPPDDTLRAGDWFYGIGNLGPESVSYDIQTVVILTNAFGDYFDQLKKLNDGLKPHYRYESGTSMSAPAVSGLLALFQDYFQRSNRKVTPALMKALLINGARSAGSLYNFSPRDVLNLQGWGVVSLTNTLPAGDIASPTGAVHAVQYADQTGPDSLVTGQTRSWNLAVSPLAADQILKFTLVWTDPPGNPNASIKLVNDLDLEVRHVEGDSDATYAGNDIPYRSDFNTIHTDGSTITNDFVNNVESILIRPPLGTNYLVSVKGRRVNVNAVTDHPDGIAQDFALVVSVENTALTNVLTFTPVAPDVTENVPFVRNPTNGLALLTQRAGANPPRLGLLSGATNQWNFFVFTNSQIYTPQTVGLTNGSNVAFITFLPPNLSRPRNRESDVDLYVSTDSRLTNLHPVALEDSFKSTKAGGTELVFFTNAPLDEVYYIGVKAEDQQGAEFGFVALSSNLPFDEDDENGNRIVRGLPYNMAVPDGSPDQPQAAYIFGVSTRSFLVQRVIATNTVRFDSTGDLLMNLSHGDNFVVLSSHALDPTGRGGFFTGVYDDSNQGDSSFGSLVGRPADGPGSLRGFIGAEAAGPWILSVSDNALTQTATNVAFSLLLEPEPPEDAFFFTTVQANSVNYYFVDLPSNATNLTVALTGISPSLPLWVALRRGDPPLWDNYDKGAFITAPGGEISLGRRDVPPLNPGRYYIGVFNPNGVAINYGILVTIGLDLSVSGDRSYATPTPLTLVDNAEIRSSIYVPEDLQIAGIKVGLRVDHPRVSDLVFHLTSPQGTRLLLSENRGGDLGTAYGADRGAERIFTTFTDDTNLTVTPIKSGIPPFTNSATASTASNLVVMRDGFEVALARAYDSGEAIAPGWQVTTGQVSVVSYLPGSTNRAEGNQYLSFGAALSSVGTNLLLTPGKSYNLRFSLGRVASSLNQGLQVVIDGILRQEFVSDTPGEGWGRASILFSPAGPTTLLEFRTPSDRVALALDDVLIEEADPTFNSYYLPEEALKPFVGQRALGDWTLEVTDTRTGPAGGVTGILQDWRLEMIFALPTIDAIRLTNGVPYFGFVDGTDVQYFYTEVPRCATLASNILAGEFATLLLFGDRDGLPVADLYRFVDDYGPYLNVEAGGRATLVLTTNFPASAPLRPGQRYYLAVRNWQPDRATNGFGIMVQFDCVDPDLPVVPELENGVPVQAVIQPGPELDYYQFVVSSNAITADFELTPLTGNVDLFVKQGRPGQQPLPSPNDYDYHSEDPDPTVVDRVIVDRTSFPVGLTPGVWYVAIRNAETVPVNYSIKVTESYTSIVNLTNGVPYAATIPAVDPTVGLRGQDLQYYAFLVSSNSVRANFETIDATGDINLYVRRGLPIPTPFDFHFAGATPGTGNEFLAVTNTTTPIWLSPGWWFLAVENADTNAVDYRIVATEFPGTIIPLTNNVAFTNTVPVGPAPDYYSFNVSPNALSATFEVFGMSDDVQLLLRRDLPLPTFNDYSYALTNSGLTDEVIELTAFSFPVGLTPGNWYLGVVNAGTNDASYIVRASEETAIVIPLTNGIPYNAAIQPGPDLDYYQFQVSSNAQTAEFKLTSAGAGDLDLFLRKGPPLPNGANAHYIQATPGGADEVIRLDTNSVPIPLSPGIWYLAVTNNAAVPIGYEITATEFGIEPPPVSGQITNVVATETNICITWISIPGTNYFVVGKSNILDAAWTPISPTLTAVDTSTTWCLEPPGPWRFFDVLEGDSPIAPIPAPVPVIRLDGTNICVAWASVPGTNYFVQAKKMFGDPDWTTLTPSIVAGGPITEVCYPIDWGYRFFRVGVGEQVVTEPAPLPTDVVDIDFGVDEVCIGWPTQPGLYYLVEAKRQATDPNWTVISEPIRGDGGAASLCLKGETEFRFFRVIEGVSVPPGAPPSLPVNNVRLSVDAAFRLCLTWDTLRGAEYFVEAKERFADPSWTVISPILVASGIELGYCIPLDSTWRYYQVRRVNRPPDEPPRIADIEVTPTGPLLTWTGPAGARYQVFYSDGVPAQWLPVGGPVTSTTGTFQFLDDGTQSGGFNGFRFYRIELLP